MISESLCVVNSLQSSKTLRNGPRTDNSTEGPLGTGEGIQNQNALQAVASRRTHNSTASLRVWVTTIYQKVTIGKLAFLKDHKWHCLLAWSYGGCFGLVPYDVRPGILKRSADYDSQRWAPFLQATVGHPQVAIRVKWCNGYTAKISEGRQWQTSENSPRP